MNTILANNIKAFRAKIGLTQEELASFLTISREEVNYYENAKRDVPQSLIANLANLFGVDEYDLFEEDDAVSKANIAFAFRASEINNNDLNTIASFKKIALNYLKIQKFLAANEC